MQARTQVHQTPGSPNECSQNIGSQRIDREHVRQAVFCRDATRFLVSNGRVVNDGIERPSRVDLFGDIVRLPDACQVACHNRLSARNRSQRLLPSLLVASVHDDAMPLLNQKLSCHPAKPIRRACDKNARHNLFDGENASTSDHPQCTDRK